MMEQTTPRMLTLESIHALAAEDLFPCGECPEHAWMVIDVQVLSDGVLLRCPTEGCRHRFATAQVSFMDDVARRTRGLLVVADPT